MKPQTTAKASSIFTIAILMLYLWAAQFAPATAQTDAGAAAEDYGQELPPEQRQALLDQMTQRAVEPQITTAGTCDVGSWQPVAPVNTGRSRTGLTYATFNGRFYLAGGEAAGGDRNIPIEEYNPATNTWTNRANLLTGVSNSGATAIGQYIYVPGGFDGLTGLATMQRYNIAANIWGTVAPMPAANYAHAVVALDNKVYVLGGSETGVDGTTNAIYNVATNNWSSGAPLPVAVSYAAAVSDGTYIYVLGGTTTDLATVQRYNPTTNTWALIPDMGAGRGAAGAFFDGANVWAVSGGWASYLTSTEYWDGTSWQAGPSVNVGARTTAVAYGNGIALKAAGWNGGYEDDAETLTVTCPDPPAPPDCTFGSWQAIAPINTPRSRPSLAYATTNGKFYLLGGEASGGSRDIPIEEYDPATNVWMDKSNLLTGVSNSGAAALEQYIYVPGGYDGVSHITALQRYDTQDNVVTTMAPMPGGNSAHAVVLHQSKIYVLGGSDSGAAGFTNFIYDVTTNSWDSGAPLPTAVQYAAAASDGKYIYVMGGNTTNLITVQRYDPAANTWTAAPIMDTARGGAAAFFDGLNVWAIGGGWSTYLASTEYFDGHQWRLGPTMNVGLRTLGAAFGDGIALKAGGWNGTYADSAELLEITCQRNHFLPLIVN